VVALQARVISQDLARRQAERGAAQGIGLARQHDWGESDAVLAQLAPQGGPVVRGRLEVPAVRDQGAHLLRHPAAQFGIAGGERDHDGFGVFAEQAEDPVLDPLLHSTDLVLQRTAAAASGMTAAMAVTGG